MQVVGHVLPLNGVADEEELAVAELLRDIKVLIDGMSTIVMPDTTPGRLSGKMTRRSTPRLLQPRSRAASIRRVSILAMTE